MRRQGKLNISVLLGDRGLVMHAPGLSPDIDVGFRSTTVVDAVRTRSNIRQISSPRKYQRKRGCMQGVPLPSWIGALFLMLHTPGPIAAHSQFLIFLLISWT